MAQRSFQKRAQYQEGRKVRGSRQARAMGKQHAYGRKRAGSRLEEHRGRRAVPAGRPPACACREPYGYFHGVLVMELVADADGYSAPRLGEVELAPETAREYHAFLVRQVVRMLCIGLIHGDLSEYNVLVGADGPVIIDLPQVVNAAGNNAARHAAARRQQPARHAGAIRAGAARDAVRARRCGRCSRRASCGPIPSSPAGSSPETAVPDSGAVLLAIDDARDEALRRQLGREQAAADGSGPQRHAQVRD